VDTRFILLTQEKCFIAISLETAKNDKHMSVGILSVNFSSRKLGASHFYSDSYGGLADGTKQTPRCRHFTHRVGPSASSARFFASQKLTNELYRYETQEHLQSTFKQIPAPKPKTPYCSIDGKDGVSAAQAQWSATSCPTLMVKQKVRLLTD
jgi:hypothetical protein